jgi:phospholipid/cholesterol/gamma-HCH transport system ATP-binding protein
MIDVRDLHKSFNSKKVLRGVNIHVEDGETLAVLGKSGEGKTVLLKHIVGLIKPDKGEIYVNEKDITKVSKRELYRIRKLFGFVFQGAALFDSLTVFENVALPLKENGVEEEEIRERVLKVLELVDMREAERLYPGELSGGMKKRVSIARALVTEPKYLLYDEPTAGLDPVMADHINDLILYLKESLKTTGIVVTHDLRSALRVSDRIVLLSGGKIVVEGRGEELLKTSHPEMHEFLRTSGLLKHG